uniref:Uncharacterized protein n=1 Tax=Lotharella oceanica TaxID=641309 RepID=A0A7S2TL59_9EUKA
MQDKVAGSRRGHQLSCRPRLSRENNATSTAANRNIGPRKSATVLGDHLREHFAHLRDDEKTHDLQFKMDDGSLIGAHRVIFESVRRRLAACFVSACHARE